MMKWFLGLFLLAVAPLGAEIATFDLGSHGQLTLYFPDGWETNSTQMGGQATLNASPKNEEVNAACSLAITFPETDQFRQKGKLKLQVEADALPLLESGAVEGKASAKEFSMGTGFGYYCNFTDPNLRGKPPIKGDYKVVSVGKIKIAPDVFIAVQITADSFTDQPYQELLGAIEGMEYKPQ